MADSPKDRAEELLRLALLCEEASGADRELDLDIAFALQVEGSGYTDRHNEDGTFTKINIVAPRYTASLDAALSLVPEGLDFAVGHGIETEHGGSSVDYAWCGEGKGPLIFAATPAVALTAAALRARAGQS